MTDYLSIHRALSQLSANDRLVLNLNQNSGEPRYELAKTSEHKHKFTLFSPSKQADNQRINRENLEMTRTIHRALVNRYGDAGSAIFQKVFGDDPIGNVTASKLRKMFALSNELEARVCQTRFRQSMLDLTPKQRKRYERNALTTLGLAPGRIADLKVKAQVLFSETPSSPQEIQAQNGKLQRYLSELSKTKTAIERKLQEKQNDPIVQQLSGRIRSQLLGDIAALREAVNSRIEANGQQISSNAFRVDNVKGGFENVYDGAILTLNELANRYEVAGKPLPEQLGALIDKVTRERSQLFTQPGPNGKLVPLPGNTVITLDDLKKLDPIEKNLQKELKAVCDLERPPLMTRQEMSEFFRQGRVENLNKAKWPVITRQLSVTGFNKPIKVTSTIAPAKNLALSGAKLTDVNGVTSMDTKTAHSCNLAVTSLTDEQGNKLFTGVRHGVNCAYGIENDAERTQRNMGKAREVVLAALETRPDLLARARAGETVELPMVSTSLLTPSDGVNGAEKTYLNEQIASWRNICDANGVCSIAVPDGNGGSATLRIKPKVLTFNFGVNFFSHTKLGHILTLGGGWANSERINNQAIGELNRAVQAQLARPDLPQKDREIITTLLAQVNELLTTKSYASGSVNPFAAPARIAILAEKCGFVPCFNCKSGKDRTSQMDAEIKTIIAQFEAGGKPEINPGEQQKALTKNMLFNAGNLELQKYSTGLAGYKLQHVSLSTFKDRVAAVPSLAALFSSQQEVEEFLGGGTVVPR